MKLPRKLKKQIKKLRVEINFMICYIKYKNNVYYCNLFLELENAQYFNPEEDWLKINKLLIASYVR